MYDELIKTLRYYGAWEKHSKEAADAIEELSGEVDALKHDIARYVQINTDLLNEWKWIPVTERLPEDGAEVLAWCESGFAYVDWFIDGKWKVNGIVDGKYELVTHWMPLPQPPKEE